MTKSLLLAVIILTAAIPAALAEEAAGMAKVTAEFYGVYAGFHPSDGIPDAKGLAKYEPFVSPALGKLLAAAGAAQARYAKANKDSPPLIEGDLFSSNFEGATASKLGACADDEKTGHCAVVLVYDTHGNKTVTWTDTVYLVNTSSGWRVEDIGYGASWAFANKGRLIQTLKNAIKDAGG